MLTSGHGRSEKAARYCEEAKASIARSLELSAEASWSPKCQVVLYPTLQNYLAGVGRGAEATIGSSLVSPATGEISIRRIDLRADVEDYLNAALPHEICHVMIADRFRDQPPPLWYDEGLALLVDPPAKLRLHHRDLLQGIRQGTTFRIADILAAKQYPSPDRTRVFYGQCAALTHFLLHEDSEICLHEFAKQIHSVGLTTALRLSYGIDGAQELEQRWNVKRYPSFEAGMSLVAAPRPRAKSLALAAIDP